MFICKNLNIEAKRSKANMFDSRKNYFEAKRMFKLKNLNIEAKRTGSIVIMYLKKEKKSELSFFFKTKGKKRKGSLVNYRSFAITTANSQKQRESTRMNFNCVCVTWELVSSVDTTV